VPSEFRDAAFETLDEGHLRLRARYRKDIELALQDLRREMPEGPFHLILCRNLAFTYYVVDTQREILTRFHQRLRAGGFLVIGAHESLPPYGSRFEAVPYCPLILRRK
jgi:chemotaxis protein methyltransferase CheR